VKRLAYALLFVAALAGSIYFGGLGTWQFWVFAIAPDLSFAFAGGPGLERGQIHPRAVPIYNAVHSLIGPALLGAVVLLLLGPGPWLVAALAWAAHIGADRALGFGPRTQTGFQRGAVMSQSSGRTT
jgi:Domain of unknown function (DUF4260)